MQMETKFPFEHQVKLMIRVARPTSMKNRVSVPLWATKQLEIMMNKSTSVVGQPGSFLVLAEYDRVGIGDIYAVRWICDLGVHGGGSDVQTQVPFADVWANTLCGSKIE